MTGGFAPIDAKPLGRSGRPADVELALYRSLFPEWSARTVTRYAMAQRMLREVGVDRLVAIESATRPNGSLNVARLERVAARAICAYARAADGAA